MLFCTAIWATYIHDTMDGDLEPIMGNKVRDGVVRVRVRLRLRVRVRMSTQLLAS